MSRLNQQGTSTPVGSIKPDFIGQDFIDTLAKLVYTSTGLTNSDWVQGGGGGGGGGFGINDSISRDFDLSQLSHTWDIATEGSLIVRAHEAGAFTLTIDSSIIPNSTEIVHNKLVIMLGTMTSLTIAMSTALETTNNTDLLYTDEFDSDFVYQTNKVFTSNNQIMTFDVTLTDRNPEDANGTDNLLMITKLGQNAQTVTLRAS